MSLVRRMLRTAFALILAQLTISDLSWAGGASLAPILSNPSMMILVPPGLTTEVNATALWGTANVTPISASNPDIPNLLGRGGSGNMNRPVVVPTTYSTYRTTGGWAFGLVTSTPYMLETLPQSNWAGMVYARDSRIYTQNFTPQVAYGVTDWLSIGAGFQFQFMQADLSQAFQQSPGFGNLNFKGTSLGYGFVAGLNIIVTPRTIVGIGYRSAIDQKLSGTVTRPDVPGLGIAATASPASFTLPMPDTVSVSAGHQLTNTMSVFGQIEWARWSRAGTFPVNVSPPGQYGIPDQLSFQWRDTWSFTAGSEYRWRPDLTLRAAIRYDQSASTDRIRTTASPGADTIRGIVGFSYDVTERLSADVTYMHNFERRVPINIAPGHPAYTGFQGTFTGNVTLGADFVSLGLRYYWGLDPLKAIKDGFANVPRQTRA